MWLAKLLADFGLLFGFQKWQERQKIEELLYRSAAQGKALPIIDGRLKKMAGPLTPMQKQMSERAVKAARFVVRTQAFEYLVQGLMSPRSSFRKQRRKITEVSVC